MIAKLKDAVLGNALRHLEVVCEIALTELPGKDIRDGVSFSYGNREGRTVSSTIRGGCSRSHPIVAVTIVPINIVTFLLVPGMARH